MNYYKWTLLLIISLAVISCRVDKQKSTQPIYEDVPYLQDYAVKYYFEDEGKVTKKVFSDRNGVIQVLTTDGLYLPINGHLQYPGTLKLDKRYMPMPDKMIVDLTLFENQFVYVDDKAVFSNAWAGKLYSRHSMRNANIVCAGKEFEFLISDGNILTLLKDSEILWSEASKEEKIIDIKYDDKHDNYYVLTGKSVKSFLPATRKINELYSGKNLTCFEIDVNRIIVGSSSGYLSISKDGNIIDKLDNKLPWPELTTIKIIKKKIWFGSTTGAFMLRDDGKFNYYYGQRWLPGNVVKHIEVAPDNSVMILTDNGLSKICFEEMTLEDKAMKFEKDVRQRKIRYGMATDKSSIENHDLSTVQNRPADSDNLWTSMYLGSQLFRYLATDSEEAKQNCYEAFEILERFHNINNIKGLFGRSIERRGYMEFRASYRDYVEDYWYDGYNNTVAWHHADDDEWDWKAHASSDQTVGQIFSMTLIAQYIDDKGLKERAVKILDDLMTYIVNNDMCLIDTNGKPTLWGRWNPEYVNRFPEMVGDRKICSSNIIAFLQTAYKFTGKEIFKEKAFELMNEFGYLENLIRPISEIGPAPENADAWSKMLSEEWNHSDDEMYFLAYWSLFPYAFNDTLKEQYIEAIRDHWESERPEKNPLWNFCYAMTGSKEFDLEQSIWTLKEWPIDMIEYEQKNSHRKDLEFLEPGFWGQTTSEILPPDERPELKHNRSWFKLDAGDRGSELSAGDTFLLPYWMGRYLGVISAPKQD